MDVVPPEYIRFLPDAARSSAREVVAATGTQRKFQFIVLEFHERTLDAILGAHRDALPWSTVGRLCCQLLDATVFLVRHGVVHGDFKLNNVLITNVGDLQVCDFGCAVKLSRRGGRLLLDARNNRGGNMAHKAPEVLSALAVASRDPGGNHMLDLTHQPAFATGVLMFEIAVCCLANLLSSGFDSCIVFRRTLTRWGTTPLGSWNKPRA